MDAKNFVAHAHKVAFIRRIPAWVSTAELGRQVGIYDLLASGCFFARGDICFSPHVMSRSCLLHVPYLMTRSMSTTIFHRSHGVVFAAQDCE